MWPFHMLPIIFSTTAALLVTMAFNRRNHFLSSVLVIAESSTFNLEVVEQMKCQKFIFTVFIASSHHETENRPDRLAMDGTGLAFEKSLSVRVCNFTDQEFKIMPVTQLTN